MQEALPLALLKHCADRFGWNLRLVALEIETVSIRGVIWNSRCSLSAVTVFLGVVENAANIADSLVLLDRLGDLDRIRNHPNVGEI